MRTNEAMQPGEAAGGLAIVETRTEVPAKHSRTKTNSVKTSATPAQKAEAPPVKVKRETRPGRLPILYMLSPQKYMSPFDCNMAADSGYKVVLPYDNVAITDVYGLVQDAMFSRPPQARTGVFLGGKDIDAALEMMSEARRAMVPPFNISVFADPGGSFTTAAAKVACVERVLQRQFGRDLNGVRIAVFGATGVVGFASGVLAALEGAEVHMVAHDVIEPLLQSAWLAKERFGATLHPVEGQTEALKAKLVQESDVILSAGPAGVNIISRKLLARAPKLLVAADVNAVAPLGVEGMDLFMNGVPLPGCSTLGIGALAIGDVKYKTQAGLFKRMLSADTALTLDFRDAFTYARALVAPTVEAPKAVAKPRARRKKKAAIS